MKPDELKTVHVAANVAEAGFLADELRAQGIESEIDSGDSVLPVGVSGVAVYVRNEDFDRARGIVKALVSTDEGENEEARKTGNTWVVLLVLAGLFIGVVIGVVVQRFGMLGPSYDGTREWDMNGDGRTDVWEEYRNDVLVERRTDRNNDGKADWWDHFVKGVLEKAEGDQNFDGKVDIWARFNDHSQYNYAERDLNFDGKADAWEHMESGVRIRGERDLDYDGKPDEWSIFKAGQLIERRWSLDGTGRVDKKAIFKHEKLVKEIYDRDHDGTFEAEIEYDGFGRVINPAKRIPH